MTDEQWLREGLSDAVPPPPANPDRARAAERLASRRRRTTALAVVGTAGAVAAAAVLTAALTSGGDDSTRDDDGLAADPPAVVECPPIKVRDGVAEGSAIDQPDPDAPAAVPEGATSARLCQGPGTTLRVPDDALVDEVDVDGLVEAINALEGTAEPEVCTMDLGPGFRIAFGYDDGSTFVVSGQLYGCRTLVVGSGYRAGPEAAQQAYLDLLAEQGGGEEPVSTGAGDLTCPDDGMFTFTESIGGPTLDDVLSSLATAIVCIDSGAGTEVSATVDPNDLAVLVADMAAHQTRGTLRCAAPPPFPAILASDAAGHQILIVSECATSWWRLPNGKAWTPSNEAIEILDRLVSEAR